MDAEDRVADDGGNRQLAEDFANLLPNQVAFILLVVTGAQLRQEAVGDVHGGRLVIPAEEIDIVGKAELEGGDKNQHLERMLPTVHIVSEEEVAGVERPAALLKYK